jgi:hypothetical protein
LPYNPVAGTKGVTVYAITVTLTLSPSPPWTAGQTVSFVATLKKDGVAWAGETISFITYVLGVIPWNIGNAVTGSDGRASLSWRVPWKDSAGVTIPCGTRRFWANHAASGAWSSPADAQVAFPTRISISAPDTVFPNQSFTISGKLEHQSDDGVWSPLAGKTVSLFYNGTKITDVTTASDGSYSASARIPTSGTYTLKASYAGEGFATAVALFGLGVGLPEWVPAEAATALQFIAPAILMLTVGGVIAYNELAKRR